MKAKVFLLALFIMNVFQMSAQNSDEVTLVVSAVGATTEDATKTALRNAIEQAYGTFVSANTTILNDELVKDEIVTIANGNIKEYKEIATNQLADGRISVTLQATVSVSKLISYAQSKGASTEFAGATFAMNMKMKELNKKNEMAALENLLVQVKQMLPYAFDRKLVIGTPKEVSSYDEKQVDYHIRSTALNYGVDKSIVDPYKYPVTAIEDVLRQGGKPVQEVKNFFENISSYYEMPIEVVFEKNDNTFSFIEMIFKTLHSLSLSEEETKSMHEQNIKVSTMRLYSPFLRPFTPDKVYVEAEWHFRNSDEYIINWASRLRGVLLNESANIVITDNLGGKSFFKDDNMMSYIEKHHGYYRLERYDHMKYRTYEDPEEGKFLVNGVGLFSPIVFIKCDVKNLSRLPYSGSCELFISKEMGKQLNLQLFFFIPKGKIMEYNNFILERKNN